MKYSKKQKLRRKQKTIKKRRNSKGGFEPVYRTPEDKIYTALDWSYTPLINAIIDINSIQVQRLLNEEHVNPNEIDSVYGWSPMKWANFVYHYGFINYHDPGERDDLITIIELLNNAGARDETDNDDTSNDGGYDFSPIIRNVPPPVEIDSDESLSNSDDSEDENTRGGNLLFKTRKRKKIYKKRRQITRKKGRYNKK
jgi:hypothetical protein